jgi:hypothetical protein
MRLACSLCSSDLGRPKSKHQHFACQRYLSPPQSQRVHLYPMTSGTQAYRGRRGGTLVASAGAAGAVLQTQEGRKSEALAAGESSGGRTLTAAHL